MSILNQLNKRRKNKLAQKNKEAEVRELEVDEGLSSPEIRAGIDFIPAVEFEMKMPTFFHIGCRAKECLLRGFDVGVWHLECSTKSDNIDVYSTAEANPNLNSVVGGVGLREKFGFVSLTQAWQTSGYLGMIGVCTEALKAILYATLKGNYLPPSSDNIKIDLVAGCERSPIKTELIIPVWKSPKVLGYVVVEPVENFILGCRMEYNVDDNKVDTHAFGLGYYDGSTEYGIKLENLKDVRASVLQRVNDKFAFALKANLFGEDEKKFVVGGQYQIDDNSLLKARVNDEGLAGVVYQFNVNENIEGSYYFGFDVNAPLKGEHKIGVCWRFKG